MSTVGSTQDVVNRWEVSKLDVASAFEEAVCVEGKQLEAFWGKLLADLGVFS